MSDDKWPFPDPRVAGVREHHERMKLLFGLAKATEDSVTKFRLMVASIYSARAIVELHYEAVDKDQLATTREALKTTLKSKLPWFDLIERIRIHDFHRFGVIPPDPRLKVLFQGGPIKLRAQKGAAIYSIPADGPKITVTGDSKIDEQRPLLCKDGAFFDDDKRQFVTLEQIFSDFLAAVPTVIDEFEKEILP